MRKLLLSLLIMFFGFISCSNKQKDLTKAAEAANSVVIINAYSHTFNAMNLRTMQPVCGAKTGSGVIISKNGYIITCEHLVSDEDSFTVITNTDTLVARLVGSNKSCDIAVLKVKKQLTPISIGNSDKVKIGQSILNIGNPLGLGIIVSQGIVGARINGAAVGYSEKINYIETDAVLNMGNSGGALVDQNGKLIGINDMLISPDGYYIGYSFAIPINLAMEVAEDLIIEDMGRD